MSFNFLSAAVDDATESLEQEITRLRSALEAAEKGLRHYADKFHECIEDCDDWYDPEDESKSWCHCGDIARERLAEVQRLKEGK